MLPTLARLVSSWQLCLGAQQFFKSYSPHLLRKQLPIGTDPNMRIRMLHRIVRREFYSERVFKRFGPDASIDDIRDAAARICRDYLTGNWKVVTADQLVVKRISGGLSNFLYYVSLPETVLPNGAEHDASAVNGSSVVCDGGALSIDDKNSNETEDASVGNPNKRQRFDSGENGGGALAIKTLQQMQQQQQEPREVLLRIYGQTHGENALETMITESVVFALLSERNFGPKLHGIFPGGRIEQFIQARPLKTEELSNHRISMKVAEKMGEIHTLNIPMSKEPDWVWNTMNRWLRSVDSILSRTDWHNKQTELQFVRSFDFSEEVKWFKSLINQGNYPVLFCHNDFQEGNILLRQNNLEDTIMSDNDDEGIAGERVEDRQHNEMDLDSTPEDCDPDLIIIDFEYCAYNYRGFDLANHFLEWTIDYSNPVFPNYFHRKRQYPTQEQRRNFIVTYLKKLNEGVEGYDPSMEEVRRVEEEVRTFSMLSHLFWGLWSVVNVTSNIEFGYWEYAVTRIQEYKVLKQAFINGHVGEHADVD